jgi:hypothetical protein
MSMCSLQQNIYNNMTESQRSFLNYRQPKEPSNIKNDVKKKVKNVLNTSNRKASTKVLNVPKNVPKSVVFDVVKPVVKHVVKPVVKPNFKKTSISPVKKLMSSAELQRKSAGYALAAGNAMAKGR